MKKKTQKPQVSEEELMTREQQLDLSSKIQIIVEKEIGSNFSFKNEGPNKSVMLKISKDKKASIDDVRYLLGHDLKIKEHDSKKNHGSGMKRTILILIPSLSLESISLIEVRHKLVLKKHGTKTGKVVPPKEQVPEVILAPVVKEEAGKNVPSVAKPQQKKRDASYGLRRYLSLILDLEGFSFERDVKTKPLDGYYNFCTDNEDVSDLILHASAWYCHNTKAVTIMKEKEVFCVVVDLDVKKPALKVWEKFNFCPPPKRGELMAKTYSRIVRILRDNKNVDLSRIHDGLFQLTFRNKKSPFLQRAMSEMQWEIYPGVSPFITKINTEMKDTMSSNFETEPVVKKEEVVAPADNVVISEVKKEEVQPKDVVVAEQELTREMLRLFKDKEDAVSQLESFVGSQEFETLTPELQTELKNIWIKSVKEDPKRFARFLIDYLK